MTSKASENLDFDRLNHVDSIYDQSGFETLSQHIEIKKILFLIFSPYPFNVAHCIQTQLRIEGKVIVLQKL